MSCNSEIWEHFALDDLWWPQFWPHINMTFVLSLEHLKTYRVIFPLVDALSSFRVSRWAHMCPPPPAVRRWFRPPAVRGLISRYLYTRNDVTNRMPLRKSLFDANLWCYEPANVNNPGRSAVLRSRAPSPLGYSAERAPLRGRRNLPPP